MFKITKWTINGKNIRIKHQTFLKSTPEKITNCSTGVLDMIWMDVNIHCSSIYKALLLLLYKNHQILAVPKICHCFKKLSKLQRTDGQRRIEHIPIDFKRRLNHMHCTYVLIKLTWLWSCLLHCAPRMRLSAPRRNLNLSHPRQPFCLHCKLSLNSWQQHRA